MTTKPWGKETSLNESLWFTASTGKALELSTREPMWLCSQYDLLRETLQQGFSPGNELFGLVPPDI